MENQKRLYVKPIVQVTGKIPNQGDKLPELKALILSWIKKDVPNAQADFLNLEQGLTSNGNATVEAINLVKGTEHLCLAVDFSHPCRQTMGRTWHTEILLAPAEGKSLLFGCRLTAFTQTGGIAPPPPSSSTPGIIKVISQRFGLVTSYGEPITDKPTIILGQGRDSLAEVEKLVKLLENPNRNLPVYVLTAPLDQNTIEHAATHPGHLARATLGLAHVYYLDNHTTLMLKNIIDGRLSAFNGAGRIYYPGFDRYKSDLYEHPLFLPNYIHSHGGSKAFGRFLISKAYEQSTINREQNELVLPRFATIRSYALELKRDAAKIRVTQEQPAPKEEIGATLEEHKDYQSEAADAKHRELTDTIDRLNSERDRLNQALQELATAHAIELSAMKVQVEEALGLAASEEADKRLALSQVSQLEERLTELNNHVTTRKPEAPALVKGLYPPLDLVGDWADSTLPGRILVTQKARDAAKSYSRHRHLTTIYQGLLTLGHDYRGMRLGHQSKEVYEGRLAQIGLDDRFSINPEQANQYGETYFTRVNGRRYFLSRHLTKGAARDPQSVVRIYYEYDSDRELVVVGHLPSHLENSMT